MRYNIKKIKKIVSAAICLIICFSAFSYQAYAEDIEHITILGDSISEGYGLKDNDKNYGQWLCGYFGADADNFAVSGKTTGQLIDQLENDEEIKSSVQNADLICVSIGGNDLLDFFFDDFYKAAKSYTYSNGSDMEITPETIENIIISISKSVRPAAVTAGENSVVIADTLRNLNPDAPIVFQTVYNPFESDNQSFKDMLPPIYTFASLYLPSVNRPMLENENILCADINKKFKGLCPTLTNMNSLDIHPNRIGHFIIAEEIVQLLKLPGNFSIFSDGLLDIAASHASLPQDMMTEITELSSGIFRAEKVEEVSETTTETTNTETENEKAADVTVSEKVEKESKKKSGINKPTIISMAAVVIIVALFYQIKRKPKEQ